MTIVGDCPMTVACFCRKKVSCPWGIFLGPMRSEGGQGHKKRRDAAGADDTLDTKSR